jgi:hypothetical protein
MRLVLYAVLAMSTLARAETDTCRTLRAVPHWSQLSEFAQRRFPNGDSWEAFRDWKTVTVDLVVDRAPHIARVVIEACPSVQVVNTQPLDPKRQTSMVTVKVTSYAALSRLAQLPAIRSIAPRRPRHQIDFEDPLM